MREIKFRTWDKNRKILAIVTTLDLEMGGLEYATSNKRTGFRTIVPFTDCELMQFTGLLDKNGREIYEGDLLNDKNKFANTVNEVYWDDRSIGYRMRVHGEMQFDKTRPVDWAKFMNIIGNICENPELVKV